MNMLGLAARNVFRNKRRTALNMVAIGVGVALTFVCLGWVQGYPTYIFSAVIRYQTGAAQILRSGYQAEAERLPLDLAVPEYRATRQRLLKMPGVAGASGRIDFLARIIAPSGSARLLGQGIDAEAEKDVTVLSRMVKGGAYLDGQPGLLLGEGIARKLKVSTGDPLLVSATDRYGVENRIALPLRGVFSFGYGAMDDSLAFVDLASAQDLLDLGDEVTRIVLAGPRAEIVERGAARFVADANSGSAGTGPSSALSAYGWQEFAKATVSAVRTDSDSFYFLAVILFGLIIVGILNSMSMSVHERHRELAALRAIGFRSLDTRRLILLESVILAAIGTVAGFIVAAPVAAWLGVAGVDISGMIPKDFPIPFGQVYHADYRSWHFLLSAALGVGASLVGSFLPARRAARLPIAETIGAGV
jgi:ABC-type lipoprotein release transport system permease subunit